MNALRYFEAYPEPTRRQVEALLQSGRLGEYLLSRYPCSHEMGSDRSLYEYATLLKNEFMRHAPPLSKAHYDGKIHVLNNALGTHTFARRLQGGKVKTKNEIRIAVLFKAAPEALLRMIVVHELAHFREKEHNRAFYKLCEHMEPDYHRLEFDTRLFLAHRDLYGALYQERVKEEAL